MPQGHSYIDASDGTRLDVWFSAAAPQRSCLALRAGLLVAEVVDYAPRPVDEAPQSMVDVYWRLHQLSRREIRPNEANLEGMFGLLPTVAFTSAGPLKPERVDEARSVLAEYDHHLAIALIDKIPRMVDYVVPTGVRIADADRVRLGAHLADGTTVMHEGFVNFNAGSLGPCMIEGRVTPGVVVGAHSDVGAGSSIMGTLSGGGASINSIGEHALLGANGGIGFPLGDHCVVEAGLYVTAGTKVTLADGSVVAARELANVPNLRFWRNSTNGRVEATERRGDSWTGLNTSLHSND